MLPENQISVVILNWLRPKNIKELILPELTQCPIIGEIIISHGRTDTKFSCYSNKIPIIHRDDSEANTHLGLSLRLHVAKTAQYPIVVFIDDDVIVHQATLINMLKVYQLNFPCIVGRFGRYINKDLTYNHLDVPKIVKQTPIALTSLLMISRSLATDFWENQTKVLDYVQRFSRPLWNGEDIFLSILAILRYDKWAIICNNDKFFPIRKLRSKRDLEVAISKTNNHLQYRSGLLKNISVSFRIHPSLLLTAPNKKNPVFH